MLDLFYALEASALDRVDATLAQVDLLEVEEVEGAEGVLVDPHQPV